MMRNDKLERADAVQAAARIWTNMTENERYGVRFGLFPAKAMTADDVKHIEPRLLSVALMDIAEKNGGMIA